MTKKTILSFLKPLVFQAAATLLAVLLLAFLMLKMEWSDETARIGVYIAYGAVCLLGGFLAGWGEKSKKFLRGLVCGLLYFVILLLVSLAGTGGVSGDTQQLLVSLGICAGAGMMGGMLAGFGRM